MHAQKYLLTDVLKDELGFTGFVVTDWAGIDEIPGSYQNDIVTAINAGIDMVMVPTDYKTFLSGLSRAAHNGSIPQERIDDAVRRILRVKFELGLFEHPAANAAALEQVGSPEHRALAAEAVRKSLVLLKNENGALPIPKNPGRIFIAGQAGKDIGLQCGGWTIVWSGQAGDITPGSTILDGFLKVASPQTETVYEINGDFVSEECQCGENATAPYGIVVLAEQPYAEGEGDTEDLNLSAGELALIDKVRARVNKLVLVLISGRPRVITAAWPQVDAVVAAWLPGTEGAAIADVLFGDVPFTGVLPYTWPRWNNQLPFDFADLPTAGCAAPLFPYGYGLTTADPSPAIPDCLEPTG